MSEATVWVTRGRNKGQNRAMVSTGWERPKALACGRFKTPASSRFCAKTTFADARFFKRLGLEPGQSKRATITVEE